MYFDRILRIYFKYGIFGFFNCKKYYICREVGTEIISDLKIKNEKIVSL